MTDSQYTIFHNPRCGKSRQALALLQEAGIEPEIRLYLTDVPTASELKRLLKKLGISARDLLRKGEAAYKELQLADPAKTEQELREAMVQHPKLIERPIVIRGDQALVARPPELVQQLLKA